MKCVQLDFTKNINYNYADGTNLTLVGNPILVEDEGSNSLFLDPTLSYQGLEVPYDSKYDLTGSKDFYIEFRFKVAQQTINYQWTTIIGNFVGPSTLTIHLNNSDFRMIMQNQYTEAIISWSGWPTDNKYHDYKIYRLNKIVYFYLDGELIGQAASVASVLGGGYPFGIFCLSPSTISDHWPLKGWVKNFSLYVDDIEGVVKGNSVILNNLKSD